MGLADPAPWQFRVEQAPAPAGPWEALSPVLEGVYIWSENKPRQINKNDVLYFRITLTTPKAVHESAVIMPYGDMGRREFLIARDIMRREVLHAKKFAGTLGQLWLVATFGPKCTACLDPITGAVRDGSCKKCMGTGRDPAYHGPCDMWWTFSNTKRVTKHDDAGAGTVEPKIFQIRALGAPASKKNDLVVDTGSGKRYYVDAVDVVSEVRRVPVVQVLTVHEAPTSDVAYKVGI